MSAFLTVVALVAAQAPVCDKIDADLPGDMTGWATRASVAGDVLLPGRAATVALTPQAQVRFAAPPERAATAAGRKAARLDFSIPADGLYTVALGGRAWVDVVGPDGRIASVQHGHGPACTSIRKVVTFPLKAGHHVLQLSDAESASMAVLISAAD